MVDEAIVDAGPPLHLQEINRLEALRIFHALVLPEKVRAELARRNLLSTRSSLHLSVPFRAYLKGLLRDLPEVST